MWFRSQATYGSGCLPRERQGLLHVAQIVQQQGDEAVGHAFFAAGFSRRTRDVEVRLRAVFGEIGQEGDGGNHVCAERADIGDVDKVGLELVLVGFGEQ